jgi:hypothetical protein
MKKIMRGLSAAVLVFSLCIATTVSASGDEDASACKGGDGGVPFMELHGAGPGAASLVRTQGMISDFLVWERRNTLVYRNGEQQLRLLNMTNQSDRLLTKVSTPLSRVVDSQERFIVSENPSVIDTWMNPLAVTVIKTIDPIKKLLFWGENTLFGAFSHRQNFYQRLAFFNYSAGASHAYSCLVPIQGDGLFQLAEGHVYPYAFLFKQKQTPEGVQLSLYQVHLQAQRGDNLCHLKYLKTYKNKLPAPVKMVYQFARMNAFAVSLDHPTKNLLWDYGKQCTYYDLENRTPYFLNFQRPYIFTWDQEGISVLSPVTGMQTHVLKEWAQNEVTAKDLWLNSDGKTLFAAVKPVGESARVMVKTRLDVLP